MDESWQHKLRRWYGWALILVSLVMVGTTAWYATEQQRCNEAFARNLEQYQALADRDREAAYDFWSSVARRPNAEERNVRLFQDWVDTFEESERIRDRQPLPPLAGCD